MHMRLTKAFIIVGVVVAALNVHSYAQTGPRGPFVRGEVLVKFAPGSAANARGEAHRVAGATQLAEIARTRVQRVRVRDGDEAAAVARYLRNPNVLYAELNYIRSVPKPLAHEGGSEVVPGDHRFHEQWALDNTGQPFYCIPWLSTELCLYSGTPDADIDAPEAWAISKGTAAVTVAVIDSGVDYTHPDLAPNFAGGDDFVFSDGDPMDDHGHGTHVAGTIAAAMGNVTGKPAEEEGVVGTAPNARILAYKVCRADGTCDDFAIQQAIARAITDGANIINMSLGESSYSQSLDDAVQDAWSAGLVIVAGAGNDGTTDRFYPAALDNVISVAAFDEDHRRPSFSNYGNWVDISAPGNVIMSTYPMSACGASSVPGDSGCYTWNTGTSMATPHVAGAAALVWSRHDVTTNAQVVDILLNSADRQGVSAVRLDSWTIHGGLNLHDAVTYGLTNRPPGADAGPDVTVTDDDRDGMELVTLDATASSDDDGSIVGYAWREGSTAIGTGATAAVWLSMGTHTLTLEVTDDRGDVGIDTVIVTVTPTNTVTMSITTAQATEAGTGPGIVTIARAGSTAASLAVRYTVGGTARAGTDYVALSGNVTIAAGASSATVAIVPINDTLYESNETVVLTIASDTAYDIGSPSTGTITVVSDDAPPDLVVSSMAGPSAAAAGTDIVVTSTTKNQGTGGSPPSKTGLYLSTNTSWDAADLWLGSADVPLLAAAATHVVSTTVHIPPTTTTGSYYVVAKADWDGAIPESSETNNVRITPTIKVGPDLVVSAVSGPAISAVGASISVTDTTKNQGAGGAAESTTRFYLSVNTLFDAADVMLGSRTVSPIAGGAPNTATTVLTIPTTTPIGTYFIVAQADAANTVAETAETNNIKSSGSIRIGPDLAITAVSVPSNAAAGGTVSVSDTTKNQGEGASPASSTGFYLSVNSTLDASDVFLGSRPVAALGAGGTASASTPLTIPSNTAAGSYYVIAEADWNDTIPETLESNNTRAGGIMRVGPDLVVSTLTGPASAVAGTTISASDTTRNQGGATAPASVTSYYLSANSTVDAGDVLVNTRTVVELGVNASQVGTVSITIPATTSAGTYYIIAKTDGNDAIPESLETNNTRTKTISVTAP